LDVPGRKIRTTQLAHEPTFSSGDTVTLTTSDGYDGYDKVPVNRPDIHEYLQAGDIILADDGTLRFLVTEVVGNDIVCCAEIGGTLRSTKGINIPTASLPNISMTERDAEMLEFAVKQGIDFVGISFVDKAKMVDDVRKALGTDGPLVLSKIENLPAMKNLDEVIGASDAIMIDRGDLSVETHLESVALFQKQILKVAHSHGKPVIVATEMLHSMIENPFPTKAEVSDISNAVLDGATALMLSGETAVGCFASETVRLMRSVADTVVVSEQQESVEGNALTGPQAMGEAVALLSRLLPVTKIIAITISGYAARVVANCRPQQPILAVTNKMTTARCVNLLFGTRGIYVDIPFSATSTDHIASCLKKLWQEGELKDDDIALVTTVGYPKSGNRMNMIQTHLVADLRESLGWNR